MQDFVAAEAVVAAVDCVVAEAVVAAVDCVAAEAVVAAVDVHGDDGRQKEEETEVNVNEYYISLDLA